MPNLLRFLAIAGAYWLTGALSLLLAVPPGYATAVWPPAGIALAAVLHWRRAALLPVWVGALAVNLGMSFDGATLASELRSSAVAAVIACGAVLQAWIGAALLRRFVGAGVQRLIGDRDIVRSLLLACPVSCLVGATIGVGTLVAAGLVSASEWLFSWCTWWTGDAIGAITVWPLAQMLLHRDDEVWRARRWLVGVPTVVGLGLAIGLFLWGRTVELRRLQGEFHEVAAGVQRVLDDHLRECSSALRTVAAFLRASDNVDRDEFRMFVAPLLETDSALRAIEWAPLVTAVGRAEFERMAATTQPGYAIRERALDGTLIAVGERAEYAPVFHLEPRRGNEVALGYDLLSEPVRRRTLQDALAAAAPLTTPVLPPVQATVGPACLLLQPVGAWPGGVAIGVLDAQRLLALGRAVVDNGQIGIAVVDGTAGDAVVDFTPCSGLQLDGELQRRFAWSAPLAVPGRAWRVEVTAGRAFLDTRRPVQAWTLLATGVLFSGLLGAFLLTMTGRTAAVAAQVRARTEELREANQRLEREATERQAAVQRLREQQQLFDQAQEQAAIGWWTLDPMTCQVRWADEVFRLFGCAPEAGAPSFGDWTRLVHDADRGAFVAAQEQCLVAGGAQDLDFRIAADDGEVRHLNARFVRATDPAQGGLRIVGTVMDISGRKRDEQALRQSLAVKDAMLQEIHHRVKNNLQIVTSLLNLQAARVADPQIRDELRQSQQRVRVMARIHEALYRSPDLAHVDLAQQLREVAEGTVRLSPCRERVRLEFDVPPVRLELEQAVPLGLLLNELLSNALKHAFPDQRAGTLRVCAQPGDGELVVTVADDGIGLPPDLEQRRRSSLGLNIVDTMVRQLAGRLEIEPAARGGAAFRIAIPFAKEPVACPSAS